MKTFFTFLLLGLSLSTSAAKLEIKSTTTLQDVNEQLLTQKPSQDEITQAWNDAYDLNRQDIANLLWPYMIGEQALPENQPAQETKEEKKEIKECDICCTEQENTLTMPCCNGKVICTNCLDRTSQGYSITQSNVVDGISVGTTDKYIVKSCPWCRKKMDLGELALSLKNPTEIKPDELHFLTDEQYAKLIILSEVASLEIASFIDALLIMVSVEQLGTTIDSFFEEYNRPARSTRSNTAEYNRPTRSTRSNTATRNINNNNNNNPAVQSIVQPLRRNNELRLHNSQIAPCSLSTAVIFILLGILTYSYIGI